MSETGGTNAAATLSLEINTKPAHSALDVLETRMLSLGVKKSGTDAPPAGITAITTGAKQAEKSVAHLAQVIQGTKFTFTPFTAGSGDILAGFKNKLSAELNEAKALFNSKLKEMQAVVKTQAAEIASISAAAIEKTGKSGSAANNMKIMLRSAEMAGNLSLKMGANLDKLRADQAAVYSELLRGDEQRAAAQKKLSDINAAGTNAAERAKALAAERQITQELKEQAQWAAMTNKERAAATLKAARALYTVPTSGPASTGQERVLRLEGAAGTGPALRAAQSAGSIAAADAAYKSLSRSTEASTAAQIHWNKVANEGHTVARGLAGSLGALWITYGQLAPLLAGAALGAAFKQAAVAGSEFEYQLTFVKALGGESTEAVDKLSESAKRLGSEGLRGPSEIASGYRILAQAGLTAAQALEAMPNVLNLATVGEMEMEQAAVTLTGVMNAFNLTVADSEHVGDVFAKAAALSQTSVQGMTEAMKTASVVGEQYGASIEDTATALTLLAKVNIVGTSGGTAFRNMLKELYAPVPAAAAAMEKLGIKTQDAQGNLRPFADVIYDLKGKLEDFSKGDQTQILQRIFGERGGKEAVAMLSLVRKEWDELRDSIKNSKGFTDTVANELESTAKGKWAQAINTMKSQLITAFQEMEPVFSNLADNLKGLFSDPAFVSSLKTIVSGVATLTSVLVEMAPALITLAQAWVVYKAAMIGSAVWTATAAAIVTFTASMQAASGVVGPALGVIGTMKGVIAGLPSLLMAIPTPLTIIAGGLAAGATAWMLWGNNASRAGDQAYDAAKRAENALTKVQRRDKYGVGDLGEAQEELDKAEKLLSLRVEGRQTGTALSDARASVDKWGEVVAALEKEKYKAQGASTDLKLAVQGKPATRKASEILGPSPKAPPAARPNKDLRKTLDENLSSAIKQEQIQLSQELIDVDIELAAQSISSVVATEKKNAATKASLEIERLLIEASLEDARVAKDGLQILKFKNDLAENLAKLNMQEKKTTLDITTAREADNTAISDLSLSTKRYIDDLEFERKALDLTASEVSTLRIERERLRQEEDLKLKVTRNQITPDKAAAEEAAIAARAAANLENEKDQQSFAAGWKKAYKESTDAAMSESKRAADIFATLTGSMESALDQFVRTGKLNFKDFATSLIANLAMIEAKALVSKVVGGSGGSGGLIGGLGGIVGGALRMFGVGGFSPGEFANLAASHIDFAKGGVFSNSPSLHAYANTVQTSPKPFVYDNVRKFAKGGVFAEAGPEAVIPLTRDRAGRLGVKSQGGDSGAVSITINLAPESTGADIRRATGQLAREVSAAVGRSRRYA